MIFPDFTELAQKLKEKVHLVLWKDEKSAEIIALRAQGEGVWEEAFPLPLFLQAAAAELEVVLSTKMAARLDIKTVPEDFWDDLEEARYGEHLVTFTLGRAGRKYLALYRAVHEGGNYDFEILENLNLSVGELLKISHWLRKESFFDHRCGDVLMEVLTRLRPLEN